MEFTALVRYELFQGGTGHFVAVNVLLSETIQPNIFVYDSLNAKGRKSMKLEKTKYDPWSLEYQVAHLVQRVCGEGKHVDASIVWQPCPGQTDGISCLWFALIMCRWLLSNETYPVVRKNHPVALLLRSELLHFLNEEIKKHPEHNEALSASESLVPVKKRYGSSPARDESAPFGDAQSVVHDFASQLANWPSCPGSPVFVCDNSGIPYSDNIDTLMHILHGVKRERDEDCDQDQEKEHNKESKTGDDDDDDNGLELN
jgi:hypothetical protein